MGGSSTAQPQLLPPGQSLVDNRFFVVGMHLLVLLIVGLVGIWSGLCQSAASTRVVLQPVPDTPGAFAPDAREWAGFQSATGLAKAAWLNELVSGEKVVLHAQERNVFGLDYASLTGRRKPLRPVLADLSDWKSAPDCPPDRVLVDPQTGGVRFFAGHDPARFQSRVVARYRGTHGDNAYAIWRGDTLFLSHWESSYHVWAFDVSNPEQPRRIGELPVANFAHGFAILPSGFGLVGTTARGLLLLDLRQPDKMQLVKELLPKKDWLALVNSRYVAVWAGSKGWSQATLWDTASLPQALTEVTSRVPEKLRPFLAGRLPGQDSDELAWFREGDTRVALLRLTGEPSSWKIEHELPLPAGSDFQLAVLHPRRLVALYRDPAGKKHLRVVEVGPEKSIWGPTASLPAEAGSLSLYRNFAYVTVLPRERGAGVVGTWDGVRLEIFEIAGMEAVHRGSWEPGIPLRGLVLLPRPTRRELVLALEPGGGGFGIHLCDFQNPLQPRFLCHVPTNGEGNRVACWNGRALYTSSTLGQWFDVSNPLQPKRLSLWYNHRWFHVRHVYGETAVIHSDKLGTVAVDFSSPDKSTLVGEAPCRAGWGPWLFSIGGGRGRGPVRLTITSLENPRQPRRVFSEVVLEQHQTPPLAGACTDGRFLYAISEGRKGEVVLLVFEVANPQQPRLRTRWSHPELEVRRSDGFWTAQGRPITAARGVVLITSYSSGPPQIIDARQPDQPQFLGRLPVRGNEWVDAEPDGPWFWVKSYPGGVQLWDLSDPRNPRFLWQEEGDKTIPYDVLAWQAGCLVGEVMLAPKLPHLKIFTVPRAAQVPAGPLVWQRKTH
jgi:hypothetical protein